MWYLASTAHESFASPIPSAPAFVCVCVCVFVCVCVCVCVCEREREREINMYISCTSAVKQQ